MAQYMILIYDNERDLASASPQEFGELLAEHQKFMATNESVLRGGHGLHPTSTATSIRRDSAGGFSVTDAPFAETKEALGGYYLVEAADLDEAVAVAKQVPAAFGGVEVRPVRIFD